MKIPLKPVKEEKANMSNSWGGRSTRPWMGCQQGMAGPESPFIKFSLAAEWRQARVRGQEWRWERVAPLEGVEGRGTTDAGGRADHFDE